MRWPAGGRCDIARVIALQAGVRKKYGLTVHRNCASALNQRAGVHQN